MKKLVLGLSMLFTFAAFAQEERPHHVFSVGADGFGWNALGMVFDWDKDKSGVKDHSTSGGSLNLNYHYIFDNGFMLGAEVTSETSHSEIKETDGNKIKKDTSDTAVGLSVGYNFNDDLYRSWWIKGVFGSGNHEDKTKNGATTTKFEYDLNYFTLGAGKRISLESWGLKNISYNPSISFTSASVDGDAEDDGLESISAFAIEIIKIDILF